MQILLPIIQRDKEFSDVYFRVYAKAVVNLNNSNLWKDVEFIKDFELFFSKFEGIFSSRANVDLLKSTKNKINHSFFF